MKKINALVVDDEKKNTPLGVSPEFEKVWVQFGGFSRPYFFYLLYV